MSEAFLPYGRHGIDDDDIAAVVAVLRSPQLTQGPAVRAFEDKLAETLRAPHVSAVSSGTAALHVAYAALGLGPGDEIVTSPITFVATANAARALGADVRFADVEPETGNLDAASVERLIGPRTRGIVAVHFGGLPADLAELRGVADRHRLWLVEDAAHALGARYRGDPVGACRFSEATTFSFHPVKHVTTAEGGAVSTRDPALKTAIDRLREHGIERRPAEGSGGRWGYRQDRLGYNYRLSDVGAALGSSQLDKLPRWLEQRRAVAARYRRHFAGQAPDCLRLPLELAEREHAYHLFPLLIDFEALGRSRAELMTSLAERGVGSQVHYIPVCDQPYYRDLYGESDCATARRFYARELSLPMYPGLTDADVDRVASVFLGALGARRPGLSVTEEHISCRI